uniref:SA2-RNase n=1 Tax=Nicotiana alata TaxID=4087 RepID=Q40384_NICAL|nr:SA2-RNase precursor [Nicotiana alata]
MLNSQITSAVLFLLFALSPIYGDFDYMQLVLTWPASFCYPKNFCSRIAPKNFTIHGLWPDKVRGRLQFCTSEKYVNFAQDSPILDDLDHHWMQLKYHRDFGLENQFLWRGQYQKHGTCCIPRYNQMQYFLLAMRLKDKFDLLATLRTHGITPGTKHTFNETRDAIKTVTNQVDPDLKCVEHIKGVRELYEIGICFTPTADSFFPCPHSNTCDETGITKILFRR